MNPPPGEHPFQVGGNYENRKGLFKVLSISGNSMEIQWDTGERTTTPVDLQAKILRNMERELNPPAKVGLHAPKSYGELFRGLQEGDFSEDVTGTHWRSREQLGGAVTSLLKVAEPFDSWSIYHRAQLHWASVSRYRLLSPWVQTKFFVNIDDRELLFGLYMERTDIPADNRDDWMRFISWTENVESCKWLHNTLRTTSAAMRNPYVEYRRQALEGGITAEEDGTFRYDGKRGRTIQPNKLSQFFAALPENLYVNMVISRVLPRKKAVAEGVKISNAIADFFNLLLPLYENRPPGL